MMITVQAEKSVTMVSVIPHARLMKVVTLENVILKLNSAFQINLRFARKMMPR